MKKQTTKPEASIQKDGKLKDYRPQFKNANKHTERGLKMLEDSIQSGGWIGAMTSANDGEIFDGSARIEKCADVLTSDPIIVETDGKRPIIIKRTDIPTANDPRAKRLALMANRTAEIDLSWDTDVLKDLSTELDLGSMFSEVELNLLGLNIEGTDSFTLPDGDKKPFQQMTFTLADAQAERIKKAIREVNVLEGTEYGNENSNGNALHQIVLEWAEQRK